VKSSQCNVCAIAVQTERFCVFLFNGNRSSSGLNSILSYVCCCVCVGVCVCVCVCACMLVCVRVELAMYLFL